MEIAKVTYSHLGGKGIFVKLKDILETKQLSLPLFVVLDALEVPKPTTSSGTGVDEKVEIRT